MTTLAEITEPAPPDSELPPFDRSNVIARDEWQRHWQKQGYVVLRQFMPEYEIDAYVQAWEAVNDVESGLSRWPACAYMHSDAILGLCLYMPLVERLKPLVGGDVGLHLCLTGWRSTTRNWHQDDYLNPPYVNSWYAAAWIALGNIEPDSGPFEVIPGSHRWPRIRRHLILPAFGLNEGDPDWPAKTEAKLTPLVEEEIQRRGASTRKVLLRRGDVLIWHGCLYHRGTVATNPNRERRACIAHYSAVHKRLDMTHWEPYGNGFYFAERQPLTVGRYAP